MYLTAQYKIRANPHDRALLGTALSRWHAAVFTVLARAKRDEADLLRCIRPWVGKDGKRRLVVDKYTLDLMVKGYCAADHLATDLHSSARASLIVEINAMLASWLGLRIAWLGAQTEKRGPEPAFPTVAYGTKRLAEEHWHAALGAFSKCITLEEENRIRPEVLRGMQSDLVPLYFGAMSVGTPPVKHPDGPIKNSFAGLIRREDGKLFAALSLWPANDAHGEALVRASNRTERGELRNVKAPPGREWRPTSRQKSAILCPLEHCSGHTSLFLARAVPKSCHLVRKRDLEYYLNVAFEFPKHEPRKLSGAVMAVVRGIDTLCSIVVLAGDRRMIQRTFIDGEELQNLIAAIHRVRQIRQAKGNVLAGDRRASRVAEHHLYSAGHQLVDLACLHGAEIVFLDAPMNQGGTRPKSPGPRGGKRGAPSMLQHRHFQRMEMILTQLCQEAGLPAPKMKKIYGSYKMCPDCGWGPGDPVRVDHERAEMGCAGCGRLLDQYHRARLLALQVLKDREPGKRTLKEFIRFGPGAGR